MEERKILTIKNINFCGKWMEFWFEETEVRPEHKRFDMCCKQGYFWEALQKMPEEYHKNGIIGLKTIWEFIDPNWEFVDFDYEKPITLEEAEKLLGRKIIVE